MFFVTKIRGRTSEKAVANTASPPKEVKLLSSVLIKPCRALQDHDYAAKDHEQVNFIYFFFNFLKVQRYRWPKTSMKVTGRAFMTRILSMGLP